MIFYLHISCYHHLVYRSRVVKDTSHAIIILCLAVELKRHSVMTLYAPQTKTLEAVKKGRSCLFDVISTPLQGREYSLWDARWLQQIVATCVGFSGCEYSILATNRWKVLRNALSREHRTRKPGVSHRTPPGIHRESGPSGVTNHSYTKMHRCSSDVFFVTILQGWVLQHARCIDVRLTFSL